MDDAEFLRTLTTLDRGLAERWKKLTGGKLKTWLGPKAIKAMLDPIFKTKKVSGDQARALQFLWKWTYQKMNDAARMEFVGYAAAAYAEGSFFAGSKKLLTTDDELRDFHTALGMAHVGKINFVSPKSGLTYKPELYVGVNGLVAKGQVKVYEVDAGALLAQGGVYNSDENRLVVYKGLDPALTLGTIVHEATHTIQDWRDLVTIHKFAEADAYVAETVAAMSTGKQYFLVFPELEQAGRLVLAGKGAAGNAEWSTAYDAVVSAVEAHPTYAYKKDLPVKPNDAEKGTDEAKAFGELLEQIKQAEAFVEWAYDAAKSGHRAVVDGITSVLP